MKTHRAVSLLITLAAFAWAAPAAAQFGIRGGVNLTKFVSSDTEEVESATGLNLGATFTLLRLGPVSIVPEVYYAQKGAEEVQVGTTGPLPAGLADFKLDYIEVPLLAKFSFALPGMRSVRPYLAAGPAFAWQLKCQVSFESVASDEFQNCDDDPLLSGNAREAMKSADRGIVVNGGLDFAVGTMGTLNLDARLVRGLARLSDDTTGPDLGKNQAFSLMLGYSLGAPPMNGMR